MLPLCDVEERGCVWVIGYDIVLMGSGVIKLGSCGL